MNKINFTIPGVPVGKGRARFSRQGGFLKEAAWFIR